MGQTSNGDYYKYVLQQKMRSAIRKKRPSHLDGGAIIQNQNVPAHRQLFVVEILVSYGRKMLPHPVHTPDLTPWDVFLFLIIKEQVRRRRFECKDQINDEFRDAARTVANRLSAPNS